MDAKSHVLLIHNPKAGEEAKIEQDLISFVEDAGYTCQYFSIKRDELKVPRKKIDYLVIAGGDGTVRRALKLLLKRKIIDKKIPVLLIPMGTANNFAKTLSISADPKQLASRLKDIRYRHIDVAVIYNSLEAKFFLEGMGFGIFPRLIKTMKEIDRSGIKTVKEELELAYQQLVKIAAEYKPKYAEIIIDGITHQGNFILIEILNIKSIGPNLMLAPEADPSDGELHVVLIEEQHRDSLLSYLKQQAVDEQASRPWKVLKAESVELKIDFRFMHVDDELIPIKKGKKMKIETRPSVLDFIL